MSVCFEKVSEGLLVRGEEEAVLGPPDGSLGIDDVAETRDGHFHAFHQEGATLRPDLLELEASHDQRKIHVETMPIRRTYESLAGDGTLGDETVPRRVERLVTAPELEPEGLASAPRGQHVVGAR
jgi:hypothetical protein